MTPAHLREGRAAGTLFVLGALLLSPLFIYVGFRIQRYMLGLEALDARIEQLERESGSAAEQRENTNKTPAPPPSERTNQDVPSLRKAVIERKKNEKESPYYKKTSTYPDGSYKETIREFGNIETKFYTR